MLKDSQTQQTLLVARNKTERKVTIMVTVIIISFIICNAPGAILSFQSKFQKIRGSERSKSGRNDMKHGAVAVSGCGAVEVGVEVEPSRIAAMNDDRKGSSLDPNRYAPPHRFVRYCLRSCTVLHVVLIILHVFQLINN
ncbi:hypothetical protein RB195_012734 [Necator americanus]|uniref:G-protein coupled receptors family 1 profile domain-containing protein n=1 Tax=Necator americanus TaxID=51031 RepID=A0ABR1DSA6_NECAM